jgi:cytochrome c5
MSDNHIPEHSSPIKTPKQLAIVVLLAFIVPVVIIVMLAQIATSGKSGPADSAAAEEAVAKRLKPAGEVVVDPNAPPPAPAAPVAVAAAPVGAPAAAAPAGDAGKGKSVYDTSCAACHTAGVAGAPKTGDKAAWSARLKTGTGALVAAVIKGKGAMPPKGGNMSLSDDDIKAAVEFMVSASK